MKTRWMWMLGCVVLSWMICGEASAMRTAANYWCKAEVKVRWTRPIKGKPKYTQVHFAIKRILTKGGRHEHCGLLLAKKVDVMALKGSVVKARKVKKDGVFQAIFRRHTRRGKRGRPVRWTTWTLLPHEARKPSKRSPCKSKSCI